MPLDANPEVAATQAYLDVFCAERVDFDRVRTALPALSQGISELPHLRPVFLEHARRHGRILTEVLLAIEPPGPGCAEFEDLGRRIDQQGSRRAGVMLAIQKSYCDAEPVAGLESALVTARALGDRQRELELRRRLGFVHLIEGRSERAVELLEGVQEAAHELELHLLEALAGESLVSAYLEEGWLFDVVRASSVNYALAGSDHDWGVCRSLGVVGAALASNASFSAGMAMLERSVKCTTEVDVGGQNEYSLRSWMIQSAFAQSVAVLLETSAIERRGHSLEPSWLQSELERIVALNQAHPLWLTRAQAATALVHGREEEAYALYQELEVDSEELAPYQRVHLKLVEQFARLSTGRSLETIDELIHLDTSKYPGSERLRLELLARANERQGNGPAAQALRREVVLELMPRLHTIQATLISGTSDPELLDLLNDDLAEQAFATLNMGPAPSPWPMWLALFLALLATVAAIWSVKRQRMLRAEGASLGEATVELEEQLLSLNSQMRDREQEIASLAHDLRNPLTVIVSGLELAQREKNDAMLEAVGSSARRMDDLLNSILDRARSSRETRVKVVRVDELLESLVSAWRPAAARKDLQFTLDLERPLEIEADPELLTRVLDNLLSNAVKYSWRGGEIALVAHRVEDLVCVTLTDEGVGIDPVEIDGIFDPFAAASSKPTAGERQTGLGLCGARAILRKLGGDLEIASAGKGKGATARVLLPRTDAEAQGPGRRKAAELPN